MLSSSSLFRNLCWVFGLLFLPASLYAQHYFVPNVGQWEGDFDYKTNLGRSSFFIAEDHLAFTLMEEEEGDGEHLHTRSQKGHHYRVHFLEGKAQSISAALESPQTFNYFLGNREKWRSGLHGSEEITLNEIYPGVSLRIYFKYGQLKYDLLALDARAISQVKFYYEGVDQMEFDEGRLRVSTHVGEVIEAKPYSYNPEDNKYIQSQFVLNHDTLSFEIDPSYKGAVVVDPTFIFSTYTGSFQDNWGYSATYHPVDSTVYGVGVALGNGFYPFTPGAFDTIPNGANDVVISRFTKDGKSMIYSTYLGGTSSEQPSSCIADSLGRLYVVGTTGSFNFPCTVGAVDTSFNAGTSQSVNSFPYSTGSDLFVSVLSPNGTSLVGSTYLGGSGNDGLNVMQNNVGDPIRGEIILSDQNTILVSNVTRSTDIPTVNAFQSSNAGKQDAWLFELDASCQSLLWSTYYGGAENDAVFALRTNHSASKVWACGVTDNTNLPGSVNGAYSSSFGGRDGFIALFQGTSRSNVVATFNGTSSADYNFMIDRGRNGDVYVFGQSDLSYPATSGAIQQANSSLFVHEFDSTLTQSKRSLCFGNGLPNNMAIAPTAFAVDDCGDIYLSGWGGGVNSVSPSTTRGMYVTPDAFKDSTDGSDLYFAVIDASFTKFNYATFFGSDDPTAREHVDGGTSRFDPHGVMYQAVCAGCGGKSTYPTFPSDVVSRINHSSNCNLAVTVIAFEQRDARVSVSVPDTVCSPFQLIVSSQVSGADWLIWDFGGGDIDTSMTVPNRVYTALGTHYITVIALDTNCGSSDTASIEFEVVDANVDAASVVNYDPCDANRTAVFTPSKMGNTLFYWDFGDGNIDTSNGTISHSYLLPGSYTVTVIARSNNCFGSVQDTFSLEVFFKTIPNTPTIEFTYVGCDGSGKGQFYAIGEGWDEYRWLLSEGQQMVGSYAEAIVSEGQLVITLEVKDTVCKTTQTVTKIVDVIESFASFDGGIPNVFTPDNDGLNDYFQLKSSVNTQGLNLFVIKVYDRWGQLVFESNRTDFKWDGTFHGRGLTEGVYFWVVSSNSNCGTSIEESGNVHLLKAEK